MNSLQDIWAAVIDVLSQNLTPTAISTWFSDCTPVDINGSELVIHTTSDFKRDIIVNRFAETIKQALSDIFSTSFGLVVLAGDELSEYQSHKPDDDPLPEMAGYTFDRFIVGNSNRFAHNAAYAVAQNPGSAYNPLFIYGNSGLGKTHLLLAIGQAIRERDPSTKIAYVKGDDFTNQLLKSIKEGTGEEFRLKYRNVDLFLVDDIQFIAGKDSTQEEFFHTFNNLYESHKQIVLTSDRPPNEMVRLEDRLRTRFEWGLLADIQPPDYETRMAIIKNKAANLGFDLPDDVCNYIAENITNNVRQIEGTVKKIKAFKELNGMVLDVPNVARAIKDMFKGKAENLPTPSLIVSEVCQYYGIEEQVLRSTLKNKNTAEARQVAMYLIRTMTNLSLPEIGREFDRDHTTVMHGLKKVEQTLQNSASPLNDTIRDITANVNNKL